MFMQRLQGVAGGMAMHGMDGLEAHTAALKLLEQGLMRQAMVMSYNDAFLVILLVNVITLPAVLLLRRPKETVHVEAVMD